MKAVVLGGTGFVGMNVVRALVRHGHEVVATRRPRGNTLFARRLGAKLVPADLRDVESLTAAMRGADVVFNCAGHYPRYSLDLDQEVDTARQMTQNSLRAAQAAGVAKYVLTSSVATVGPAQAGRTLSTESDPMHPRALDSVYFACKHAIEREVLEASGPLHAVVLCPTGIIGELDVKAGTGFVVVAVGNGLMPFFVDGRTNMIDADEMAEAHVAAADRAPAGSRFIVAGHNVRVRQLLELICDELGVRFASWALPLALAEVLSTFDEMRCAAQGGRSRPFIPREFVDIVRHGQWVDGSRAVRELGLAEPAPLRQTVRKACAWYLRYRYIQPDRVSPSWNAVHREAGRRSRAAHPSPSELHQETAS